MCKGYSCRNHWNKLITVLPLPYTNHNINMLNVCNPKHDSEAQLDLNLIPHSCFNTSPKQVLILSAEICKSFKCKLSIHHPHFSLVQFGCQGFFRQLKDLHILQLQFRHGPCLWGNKMGWEKPALWQEKTIPKFHLTEKNGTGTLASWGPFISLWGQVRHLCISDINK